VSAWLCQGIWKFTPTLYKKDGQGSEKDMRIEKAQHRAAMGGMSPW